MSKIDSGYEISDRENRLYSFMRMLIRIVSRIYFRLETRGIENLPETGGVMLVANHLSNIDPTTIACLLPRQVYFLAKEDLFVGLFGKFLRATNSFPVSRSGVDRKAIQHCIDLLKHGKLLLIFPEGQRSQDGSLAEAKPGASLIAAQAKCRIVPVAIEGSLEAMPTGAKFIKPAKVRVLLGKPFELGDIPEGMNKRTFYDISGRLIMEKIGELQKQLRTGK